ncbi:MAG: hypothetical protein PHQ98_03645 [Candidatus ainarchaeum sp.]|nr:hypothetical protein [Candidatus ainarchaeum sp.]
MQIDKVYLIVHPLLDQSTVRNLSKADKLIIKNELHNFGQLVNESVRKKENALFIVVPSRVRKNTIVARSQDRLISFIQRKLNSNFKIIGSEFGYYNIGDLITSNQKNKAVFLAAQNELNSIEFSKNVHVQAVGQYLDCCVKRGALNICELIGAKGVHTTYEQLNWSKKMWSPLFIRKEKLFTKFSKWRRELFGKRKLSKPKI